MAETKVSVEIAPGKTIEISTGKMANLAAGKGRRRDDQGLHRPDGLLPSAHQMHAVEQRATGLAPLARGPGELPELLVEGIVARLDALHSKDNWATGPKLRR